ncbi:MAG TPA: hypothetical protein VK172_14835 [Lentimicrobium sp.]|nr:hypothetical protein [Bacteroidales bacterium]HLO92438.1 hypothetical protein [Lentimicrobium sp.]
MDINTYLDYIALGVCLIFFLTGAIIYFISNLVDLFRALRNYINLKYPLKGIKTRLNRIRAYIALTSMDCDGMCHHCPERYRLICLNNKH